jgi:hypothetical protein
MFFQEIVSGLGSSLKELHVCSMQEWTNDIAVLLRSLHNLEDLVLPLMMEEDDEPVDLTPLFLPKLKTLRLGDLENSLLMLFSNVSSLESFFICSDPFFLNGQAIEDFILRQDKLKELQFECFDHSWGEHPMFSDLSRVKFRLESIDISGMRISKENAVKFLQQQRENLKTVRFGYFIEPSYAEYVEILRTICTLPKLENIQYREVDMFGEDFIALNDIRNESVTHVGSKELYMARGDGRIFEMFPNIKSYGIHAQRLEMNNVPCEKLATFEIHERTMTRVVYLPPLVEFDQEKLESRITEFLRCFDQILHFEIGRDEWIGQGIKLTNDFWQSLIESSLILKAIVIYNSSDVKELVQILINCKRDFNSVRIWTDVVGKASVKGMGLPSWLEVIIFR